jgi:hypothetical protein
VNVTAGSDPLSESAYSLPSTSGRTGDCNGSGACAYYPFGTVCVSQTCSGNTLYYSDTCSGVGACVDNGSAPCPGHLVCQDATNCRTTCTQDSHCVSGYYCASGSCQVKKATGNTCGLGNECVTGNCVDGYCCNNTCTSTCMACNVAGSLGTCSAVPNNTDPINECGLCKVCNGSGACKNVSAGSDPKDECALDDPLTCQKNGNCNGSGACALYASGTVCIAQTCTVGTGVKYYTDYCNGTGTCQDSGSVSCEPYACGTNNDCRSNCTGDSNCFSGYYCVSGICCSPVVGNSGSTCGTGTAYSYTHNNTTPTGTDVTANIVPTTAERWFRFTTIEYLNDMNVWIWFTSNPGDEFRIEVHYNTVSSTINTCAAKTKATGTGSCTGEYTNYSWAHGGTYPWTSNDSNTFYVRVYRKAGATPTCNSFTLRIRVGGGQPWT